MGKESAGNIDERLLEYLGKYITDHKKSVIEKVLIQRTRFFTVVLEDIFKPHNASAVLRSCDCFGIQDVHVIEKAKEYKVNPFVTRGASQWVDLYKYNNADGYGLTDCFSNLRSKGYKVLATSPSSSSIPLEKLNPNEKIALVFGNEHEGVSKDVIKNADGLAHVPMLGFTESFNISVAASLFLHHLTQNVNKENVKGFYLSDQEKSELKLKWYRSIVKNSEIHERVFLESLEG
ncbi:RNA methyltransferase [Algoriphagus sp. SE2]|uniref:TrmH family RNA methyltransferase n=1 Tax=Algoriphagus sp. SE2 TaxID=3141536 RepID=UPI0031CD73B9